MTDLLDCLPYGAGKRATYQELMRLGKYSTERELRRAISKLKNDYEICGTSDAKGFYRPVTDNERLHQIRETLSRIRELYKTIRPLVNGLSTENKKSLKDLERSLTLDI